jgi:hypothetical protein
MTPKGMKEFHRKFAKAAKYVKMTTLLGELGDLPVKT